MIVRRKWIGPEAYVEVCYRVAWLDGQDYVDITCFMRDPRKAQFHKPKYWRRGSSHTPVSNFLADGWYYWKQNKFYIEAKVVIESIQNELGRTSSDRRAAAS